MTEALALLPFRPVSTGDLTADAAADRPRLTTGFARTNAGWCRLCGKLSLCRRLPGRAELVRCWPAECRSVSDDAFTAAATERSDA